MTTAPIEPGADSGPGGDVIPIHSGIDLDATAYFERGDQVELAEKLLTTLGPEPLTYDAGEVWRYNRATGIWEAISAPRLRTMLASFAGCPIGLGRGKPRKDGSMPEPAVVKLTAPAIAGAHKIAVDQLEADPERVSFAFERGTGPRGIAFADGFVLVRDGRIEVGPHRPENRARHAFPFPFLSQEPTPMFDKFLFELFSDVSQFERDLRIAMLQEYTGICLIGEAPKFQRCLIVFATGGNGKSELLHILRGLFPPDAQTSLVPQWWGNQFRSVMLEGKLANFCDELPDAEIMGGESWKLVITGEPIPMERKHKDAFMFPCTAGHIFCTNTAIRTTDHSVGFWRRPLALSLTRKFEDDPGRILEAGRRVLEAEHAGIVAWAIHGAARAQLQRGYTMPPSSHELVTEWRDENDQVRGYFLDHPLRDRISASDLYRQYVTWAKESGLGPMSITMFGRRIMAAELADRIKDGKSWYQPKGMNAAQRAEMANRAALEAERERMNCG